MPSKSFFSKEQKEELSALLKKTLKAAVGNANANANKTARLVAESERTRLAGLIEDFAPISEGKIVNLEKSLKALADAIRSGRHD
jgi:hypothetical protein